MKKNMQSLGQDVLSRNQQKKVLGGNMIWWRCTTTNECFPSAFQCGKGCPGGSSKCLSTYNISLCVF